MLRWLLPSVLATLAFGVASSSAEEDIAAKVEAGIREVESYAGTSFHLSDRIAALGSPAVPAIAAVLGDPNAPEGRRAIAAWALGRIHGPESLPVLQAALTLKDLPETVREAVEESCYLQGDTEAVDSRVARLGTAHRDIPVAASGARLRIAKAYAATGRFRIAAGLMKDLVHAELEARPEIAQSYAYNWACDAALAGDKSAAIEAVRIAVESDRTDLDWITKDLDLAPVQGDETFVKLVEGAKERRSRKTPAGQDLKREPGYAEYRELHDAYWNVAFETYRQANNRYWDDFQPWLEKNGKTNGPEASDAFIKEKGPLPTDPTDAWVLKFQAFIEKNRGTAIGRHARGNLFAIYANQRKYAELVDLYLAALAEAPNLDTVAEHAPTALGAASREKRLGAVREALSKAVAAHPDDPHAVDVLLALAESMRGGDDKDAARAAYAEIVKRFPGTDAAKDADGVLYEMEKLVDGAVAPDFAVTDIRGGTWSPSALRGKVVLLDFWATWCGPCLGEIPALKAIQKEHTGDAGQDFVMLGISLDADGWELAEFLDREGIRWPQVCDLRDFEGALAKLYHVRGIPRSVLIDRKGRIASKDLRGEKLAEAVRQLLSSPK